MIKEIIFGTKNPAKIAQIQGALLPLGITVKGIDGFSNLPDIKEIGQTAQENSRLKALTYAKSIGQPVFSMDNALYFDDLPDDEQPGIRVRHIGNKIERPTDDDLIKYYSNLIAGRGRELSGRWEFAVALATPQGDLKEKTIISSRKFTSKISPKVIPGYPLESLQIDPESGKYISEMTNVEQTQFWQKTIGSQLRDFFSAISN